MLLYGDPSFMQFCRRETFLRVSNEEISNFMNAMKTWSILDSCGFAGAK
jgi:hypothetical protein